MSVKMSKWQNMKTRHFWDRESRKYCRWLCEVKNTNN